MNFNNPQLIWWAIGAVVVLAIVGLIAAGARRSRTAAEEELVARAEEARAFDIRRLNEVEAARYRDEWKRIEARFIDRPVTAVAEADEMIGAILRTMGDPIADFEKYASLPSVKHPRIVEHDRAGHAAIEAHATGSASTEDLRQAMLHDRALFSEMAGQGGTDTVREIPTEREVGLR